MPITVSLPDGTTINATHYGYLKELNVPLEARKVLFFPELQCALLSVSALCDTPGVTVTFTNAQVTVTDVAGNILLSDVRHGTLYQVNLPMSTSSPPSFCYRVIVMNLKLRW
jgi:hypothetical protein